MELILFSVCIGVVLACATIVGDRYLRHRKVRIYRDGKTPERSKQ
jgi:dolichol kinase